MQLRGVCVGRVSATLVVLTATVMIFQCASYAPSHGSSAVLYDALESPGDRTLSVGVPGLQSEIQTLNPLLATSESEFFVIWSCYSTLLTRDADGDLIGGLAAEWEVSPDGLTWRVKIIETASFYDRRVPAAQVPVTVDDIIFTYWLVQNASGNNLPYCLPEIPGTGGALIETMIALSDYDMEIKLRVPYSPFVSALTTIPILPEYIWSARAWNWQNYDGTYPPIVGSGAWYYALDAEPDAGIVNLQRNPTWFGELEYGWQLHVDRLILRSETEDSNYMNYLAGINSVMTRVTPGQYTSGTLGGSRWQSSQGFVFEFNMNQLTDENRDLFGIGHGQDYNNQLLLDPVVKIALQMSIDKELFVAASLEGLGKPADSLMPETSPWRYDYGGPEAPPGEVEIPFDPGLARMMLYDNGWRYRLDGTEILSTAPDYWNYYPLSRLVGGVPSETLSFRFVTLDSDSFFVEGSMLIEQWAAQTGIDLVLSVESVAAMNSIWYTADYDTWFWDWVFDPTGDPSTEVMQVLTTEAIGSWSDVYWSNSTYDTLYYASLSEMDISERRLILDEMQRMAYEDSGCWPVAWMDSLYAGQSVSPEFWENWGNWTESYQLTVDSAYPWLFTQIYPADNPAPQITDWLDLYETDTLMPVSFSATVVDLGPETPLEYRWNFGDGTTSAWQTSPGITHSYPTDGYYSAWMMVREAGTADGFMTSKNTLVVVLGCNGAPYDLTFTHEPSDPDTGTVVYFNGSAVDDDGDSLAFSWDFGDGEAAIGQNVTHQFSGGAQTYVVTMYVDDGHLGIEPRPVAFSREISVSENLPPSIDVPARQYAQWKSLTEFRVVASDPDPRDTLKYTWDWGDGSPPTVTYTNTAMHVYYVVDIFDLVVWCDDQTGLDGHNMSDSGQVLLTPNLHPPVITSFWVSNNTPAVGEAVTFYGTATDREGYLLSYTWEFGDGTTATMVQLEVNSTLAMDHIYTSAGPALAYLTVSDGTYSTTTTDPVILDVKPLADGMLRAVTNPAVPGMIYIDGDWMSRWGLDWVKLAPGEYTLSFGDVLGFVTPEPQTITIVAGEITYAEGVYVPMGSLRVITDPAVPSTVYVNDLPRNDWGFWNYVPAGTYTVSFGAVADMVPPPPQTVMVTPGAFQQVTGIFTSSPGAPGPDPETYGMLRVTSNPAVPTMVYLDGEWMSHWGLDWVKLAPGEYTLSFSDIPGFVTPADQSIMIVAGEITYAEGVYASMGILRVMTSPPVPSTIYVNDIARNDWGLWVDVPVGTYIVSFGDVEGLTAPASQEVTVTAGGYTEVTGIFT